MTLGITGTAENAAHTFERADYAVGVLPCVHVPCTKGELSRRGVNLSSWAIRTARAWMAACIAWGHSPTGISSLMGPLLIPFGLRAPLPQQRGKAAASAFACTAGRSFLLTCLCLHCWEELFARAGRAAGLCPTYSGPLKATGAQQCWGTHG